MNIDFHAQKPFIFTWAHTPITVEDLHIEEILTSPYSYQQGMVRIIESESGDTLQHTLTSVRDYAERSSSSKTTLKIEGMERITEKLWKTILSFSIEAVKSCTPFSCHCFIAGKDSPSFDWHTDPDNVVIYVLEGTKKMYVDNEVYEVAAGDALWIPYNTRHRAVNTSASVMLSIGLERYHMEKLCA